MSCKNCEEYFPGKLIKVNNLTEMICTECGKEVKLNTAHVVDRNNLAKWDQRFYRICCELASWSSCLSRQIGAVLVRDKTIIATGYNGPPRGLPHCGAERRKSDVTLFHRLSGETFEPVYGDDTMCPRQRLGFSSGDGLHLCPAAHAEDNCISNAARTGVVTMGATMYISCGVPCKNCLGKIINAGIVEVVCETLDFYDEMSSWMIRESKLKVRLYEKKEIELDDKDFTTDEKGRGLYKGTIIGIKAKEAAEKKEK